MITIDRLQERKAAMKLERSSFDAHWLEISEFTAPHTMRYLRSDRNKGYKYNAKIINDAATNASQVLQSGMMAGMSSPARPWFALGPPDPDMKKFKPVKMWLETATAIMLEYFGKSNIYSILPKQYGGIGDYGTAAMGIFDDKKDVFRAYQMALGSYWLDLNNRLQVDCFHREYIMTVRQLITQFGKITPSGLADWSMFSTAVRNLYDRGSYGAQVPVCHAVEPNSEVDPTSFHSRDKAYASVTYEEGETRTLEEMGFDEFPIIASRWRVNECDVYGTRCPGMDVLGAVKGLQHGEKTKYKCMDKLHNPPMNSDATLRNTGADLLPGGMNFVPGMSISGNPGMRPVMDIRHLPQAIQMIREDNSEVESRIRRAYYADLMLMLATSENSQMTAREIEERHSEKLLVLGPMLEQQNDDTFDPLIDRAFNMLFRAGKFPPPPQELQGDKLRVEYISTMAQAQKLIGVSAHERFVGFVGQVAAFSPEVLDKFNADESVDDYALMTGVNGKIVRTADEVIEIRTARAKAAQAQKMAEMAPAMAQGAQAMQTMSQTQIQGENALDRMIQGAQGGAL